MLLLVLGIIALLSLLAVSFVFQSRLELRSAQHFESTTSADEVANAGAQAAIRLLELDKQRRLQGTDGIPDTGNEEPYDALIDIWRGGLVAPIRLTWAADDPNEGNLTAGDRLVDTTGTLAVGTILGVTTAGAGGTVTLITENPAAWQVGDTITNVATPATLFSEPIATVEIPGNAVDLNADAAIQGSNTFDDDNDGVADPVDEDEGLDAIWQNYYDTEGRLRGRYAVLVEDENAKANVNVIHNLANPAGLANNNPTDNTFGQNEGATTFEINAEEALNTTAVEAQRLVFYRHGRPQGNAGTAYDPTFGPTAADPSPEPPESNRIYVPGQGLADTNPAAPSNYSNPVNDDDDANRFFLDNWYNVRTGVGAPTFNGADDDNDGCIDEFDETGIFAGDGVDNDGDGCIDERDEGVNEPTEFSVLTPARRQPHVGIDSDGDAGGGVNAPCPPGPNCDEDPNDGIDNDGDTRIDEDPGPEFEQDGINNDGDVDASGNPIIDEANEGDDQPILSIEDLVSGTLLNLPTAWLTDPVNNAGGTLFTVRRNLLSIQSQDRNLDRLENPRTNPNYATAEEIAAAARSPFARVFDTFREVEFQTYQAAINLYDYRDRNLIRDEVQDAAGNVFAGVESVRINEIMVAPRTDIIDPEIYDATTPGTPPIAAADGIVDATQTHALPPPFTVGAAFPASTWTIGAGGGSGRPRGPGAPPIGPAPNPVPPPPAGPGYLTNPAAGAAVGVWEYSGAMIVNIPANVFPAVATDNDTDGLQGEDPAVDTDTDGVWADEDVANGIDDDGDGAIDEDPREDEDLDNLFNEDGTGPVAPDPLNNDYTFKLVMRVRTNVNELAVPGTGIPLGTAAADRGFLVFVNGDAVYPAPAAGANPGRWGIPPTLNAVTDGIWFIQQGVVNLLPGNNTIYFLKPAPTATPVDDIDIDWFYFTREPDDQWIELVNIGEENVDVSNWQIRVDAKEDLDQSAGAALNTAFSTLLTIPAAPATVLLAPRNNGGQIQHTVLAVDANAGTPVANQTLDDEAGNTGLNPDLIAFDQVFTVTPPAGQLVQFGSILNIFTRPSNAGAAGPSPGTPADDFVPEVGLFPTEPIDDQANNIDPNDDGDLQIDEDSLDGADNDGDTLVDEDPSVRNTPDQAEGIIWRGIDVAIVSLLDASGSVVDRVTYDGTQWNGTLATPRGTIRGFRSLERLNPVWAGDTLVQEQSIFGAPVSVDNFYRFSNQPQYADGDPQIPQRVLSDGNYDNWFPDDIYGYGLAGIPATIPGGPTSVSTVANATPGTANDVDGDTILDTETTARVKNRHLSNVGELGTVPFADAATSLTAAGVNSLFDANSTDTLRLDEATNTPRLEVALVTYGADSDEANLAIRLAAPATLTVNNTNQVNSRVLLRVDTGSNTLLVFDDNNDSPWELGDTITVADAGPPAVAFSSTITAIHQPQAADVAQLIDAFTVEAQVLEATLAESMIIGLSALDGATSPASLDVSTAAASTLSIGDALRDATQGSPEVLTITGIAPGPPNGVTTLTVTRASPVPHPIGASYQKVAWANSAVSTPVEWTTPITTAITEELSLVWSQDDGIVPGTYNLYVFGQAGALLNVDVLDENNVPIGSLNRTNLEASEGDHLIAFGILTLPAFGVDTPPTNLPADRDGIDNDLDGRIDELELRLRFTNAGAAVGSPATQNRVTRVVLAPPDRTLGRININTASDRVLRGLPNLQRNTVSADGLTAITIAERIVEDRQINGPFTSIGDLMSATRGLNNAAGGVSTLNGDGVDNDNDGVTDELTEAEDVFRAISNLITVRSDLFKIIALGQAAVDANNDGIVQADEVRAEKKLEFVYER